MRLDSSEARQVSRDLFLIAAGCFFLAVAINGFLIPHSLASGGVLGLAIVIHYQFAALPVSVLYLLMNIPLYALGWHVMGHRFFAYTLIGTLILSAMVEYVYIPIPITDHLQAGILGGLLVGIGLGLVLLSRGSTGGRDIIAVLMLKWFSCRVGTTILGFELVVLTGLLFATSLEATTVSLVSFYITAKVCDAIFSNPFVGKALRVREIPAPKVTLG